MADKGVINGYTDGTYRPSGNITRAEFLKLITVAAIGEEEANNVYVPDDYYMKDKWYGKYVYWAEENYMLIDYFEAEDWEGQINRIEMVKILYKFADYKGLSKEKKDEEKDIVEEVDEEVAEETVKEFVNLHKAMIDSLKSMGYKNVEFPETTMEEIDEMVKDFSVEEEDQFYKKTCENLGVKISKEEKRKIYTDVDNLTEFEYAMLDVVSGLNLLTGYEDGSFKPEKKMTRAEVVAVIYRFM